jgi:hypothetical protein
MMHPVENGISPWREIRTPLAYPSKHIKEPFPELGHGKHLVGCIAVEEETLAKQREIPVKKEKDNQNHVCLLI